MATTITDYKPELTSSTLKLDFDFTSLRTDKWTLCKKILKPKYWIFFTLKLEIKELRVAQTRKGFHVYVELEKQLPYLEVYLLQSLLGSDFRRETFNYSRYLQGVNFNILFKKKMDGEGNVLSEETPRPEYAVEIMNEWNKYLQPKPNVEVPIAPTEEMKIK